MRVFRFLLGLLAPLVVLADRYIVTFKSGIIVTGAMMNLTNGEHFHIGDLSGYIADIDSATQVNQIRGLGYIDDIVTDKRVHIYDDYTDYTSGEYDSDYTGDDDNYISISRKNDDDNHYQWGLDRIDQANLPLDKEYGPSHHGKGTYVYVLDTGVRKSHVEFGGRVSYGYSHFGKYARDGHGHGTHVMSTVLGATVGVSNRARGVAVKVLDDKGGGSAGTVIKGLEWSVKHIKSKNRCGIISMSLGGGRDSTLNKAVNAAAKAGVRVVVAAGNSNKDACNFSPASASNVTTVGATNEDDDRSHFSNFGNCTDIFAPGSRILGASHESNTGYTHKSGTSMACPHVAGAFAMHHICSMDTEVNHLGNKGKLRDLPPGTPNLLLEVENITVVRYPTAYPTRYPRQSELGVLV
jgi:subtilisin family serine protease